MLITKLRTTFALLAAALTVAFASFSVMAAFGPVTAAHAEDNDPEMSQDQACGMLQDAYNGAAANASAARAAGNESSYEFWANLASEAYLDAEFDWQCDWAQEALVHSPGGNLASSEGRFSIGLSAVVSGPIGPPASAAKNVHAFQLWLASKDHGLACGNVSTLASSLQKAATQATRKRQTTAAAGLASEVNLIKLAAHFTHCGWAAVKLPATTSGTSATSGTSGTSAKLATPGRFQG
jgi:hypothetical protein